MAVVVPTLRRLRAPLVAQSLAEGVVLGGYRFDAYQEPKSDAPKPVRSVGLLFERLADRRAASAAATRGKVLAESQNLARHLSNEPANALPPAVLAR